MSRRMNETFFYDPYSQETHPDYWDCECEKNYIHSRKMSSCVYCGASACDQPDSHISELYAMHYKNLIRTPKHLQQTMKEKK